MKGRKNERNNERKKDFKKGRMNERKNEIEKE